MTISAYLNTSLLQPASNARLLRPISNSLMLLSPLKAATQPLQQTQTSVLSAPTQLALDAYTPSNAAYLKQPATVSASSSISIASTSTVDSETSATPAHAGSLDILIGTALSASDVPQSVSDTVANDATTEQQAFGTLAQSLASGSISSAKSALEDYNQALPASTLYMSSLTTPSAHFLSDLKDVDSALSAGNITAAQASFASAQLDHPVSVAEATSTAKSALSTDLTQAMQGLESTSDLSKVNTDRLSQDAANLAGLSREAFANISDSLIAHDYSSSNASTYAGELTSDGYTMNASVRMSNGTEFGIETYTNYLANESISGGTNTETTISGSSTDYNLQTNSSSNVSIDEHTYAITSVAVGMVTSGGDYTTLLHDQITASAESSAVVQASGSTNTSVQSNVDGARGPNDSQVSDVSTSGSVFLDDVGQENDSLSLFASARTQASVDAGISGSADVLDRSGSYANYLPNVIRDIGAVGNSVTYLVSSRPGESESSGITYSSAEVSTSNVIDSTTGYFASSTRNVSTATNMDSYGSLEQSMSSQSQGLYSGESSNVSTQTTVTLNDPANNPMIMANAIVNRVLLDPSYALSNQEISLLNRALEGDGFGNSVGFSVSSAMNYDVNSSSVNLSA